MLLHSALVQKLEQAAQLELLVVFGLRQPAHDGGVVETLGKVHVIVQLLDGDAGGALVEDGRDLDVLVHRAVKVIRGSGTVSQVKGALALGVARGEDLVDVGFAATGTPAGAVAVLGGAGDAAVESPDGGRIAVE